MLGNYCNYCCNAKVDPLLSYDNDLSYFHVGEIANGYFLHIRSGDSKPTSLIVSRWDKQHGIVYEIGFYKMKYCPECGRRLFENN